MIYGIGTDILQIVRIKIILDKYGDRFVKKILGPEEIKKYIFRKIKIKERGIRFLAIRFAVKEAFSKAIKIGMCMPMTWSAVQTINADHGKPIVKYSGKLKTWIEKNQLITHVSISDEQEYVVAFVIVEQYTK